MQKIELIAIIVAIFYFCKYPEKHAEIKRKYGHKWWAQGGRRHGGGGGGDGDCGGGDGGGGDS